ncbi:MMPL family transporter [Demequina sp. TTPB684]|uniref:MMPL family transporter n=1 Tax=unclassified Demequina TaxID=2620311 RepID=UPI001CF2F5A9|nr:MULTISPECIES: MMPL family transporter [unclassified Demequina]MCB2411437.1 MMPL family transporter [Demequina sp. TTPB684]UPU87595.1 MMPL family transporter [Demequina sp. TMPB413]
MKTLARLATTRPILVLLAWLTAVVGLTAASAAAGPDFRDTFSLPGTDSQATYDLLDERFPQQSGDADTVVVSADAGDLSAWQSTIEKALAEMAAVPSVAQVTSPFTPKGASQLSADGSVGYATVAYDEAAYNLPIDDIEHVAELTASLDAIDGLTVGHGGGPASRLQEPEVGIGELIGLLIAGVILVIAFGSGRAATVPLISAIAAVTATVGTLGLASNLGPLTPSASILAVLLGLGIGIDYALFIVNRHRHSLKAGRGVRESVTGAMATSGRAVVFAGITVFIALAGMLVPQIAFLTGLAITAAITVAFSVAASATLVPALLTLYGTRILGKSDRAALAEHGRVPEPAATQGRFARLVERRPLGASLAAVAFLAFLAIPALDIRLGNSDAGNDPAGTPSRVAFDLMSTGFGAGTNGAVVVAVDLGETGAFTADALAGTAPLPPQLAQLAQDLADDAGVAAVIGPVPNAAGDTALLRVVPDSRPQSEETNELVERIRSDYAPAATNYDVHVGGVTASNIDFTDRIADSIPLFFALVVGLSMVVLLVAFRSLVLPLVGAALNLLSAGAAFGISVAVFQWGWGHQLFGVGGGGPVEPFIPLILFALLFGLSMDYQVFLVSRMAELWHSTRDNAYAVRRGLAEVSRVIVAAASIMVVVFGSFVTSDARFMKLLGLGLAVAIFLDAFVIRVVLMPAIMRVLGARSWWIPQWLDRLLPHIDIDGHDHDNRPPTVIDGAAPREPEPVLAR